jgi:hypothetical protein
VNWSVKPEIMMAEEAGEKVKLGLVLGGAALSALR